MGQTALFQATQGQNPGLTIHIQMRSGKKKRKKKLFCFSCSNCGSWKNSPHRFRSWGACELTAGVNWHLCSHPELHGHIEETEPSFGFPYSNGSHSCRNLWHQQINGDHQLHMDVTSQTFPILFSPLRRNTNRTVW